MKTEKGAICKFGAERAMLQGTAQGVLAQTPRHHLTDSSSFSSSSSSSTWGIKFEDEGEQEDGEETEGGG